MEILHLLLAQLAKDKGESAITSSGPTRGDARDIKWQVEADDQRASADRFPEYFLDEGSSREDGQLGVCATDKRVHLMCLLVGENCINILLREPVAIEKSLLDGQVLVAFELAEAPD